MRQKFAHVPQALSVQDVAVVRPVEDAFDAVQFHPQTRPGQRHDRGAQVMQQRLDLPPMNIAARRLAEDRSYQLFVLVAHAPSSRVQLDYIAIRNTMLGADLLAFERATAPEPRIQWLVDSIL